MVARKPGQKKKKTNQNNKNSHQQKTENGINLDYLKLLFKKMKNKTKEKRQKETIIASMEKLILRKKKKQHLISISFILN